MTAPTLTLPRPAGFSLEAGSRFVMTFPAMEGGEGAAALNLAFALDRAWHPVGVRVVETSSQLDAEIVSNPDGAPSDKIRGDLVRILSIGSR